MSNRSRLGLIVLAAGVAVVAFVVLSPGDTDEKADDPANRAGQTTTVETTEEQTAPTATAPSAPPPAADEIVVKGGKPEGGVQRVAVAKGDTVRLLVSSDGADEIHLHGYDITRSAGPGKPARFRFKADVEGVFEIESHTADDADLDPLVGRLVVEPG
jgi:hypothetical protein